MSKKYPDRPKLKMQNVSFESVDDFLAFLPDDELNIVKALRQIVFSCIPDLTEKLSFNVPFYSRHRSLCFIWPAAVLWGKKKSYQGVRFGFIQGHLMSDEIGYLDRGNRKQIFYRDFLSLKEIDIEILKAYIYEAMIIDEQLRVRAKK